MNISLKKFESDVDNAIVNCGSEYFANQAVRGLRQIKADQWTASVDGAKPYQVRISCFKESQRFRFLEEDHNEG